MESATSDRQCDAPDATHTRRASVFVEVDVDGSTETKTPTRPQRRVRFCSKHDVFEMPRLEDFLSSHDYDHHELEHNNDSTQPFPTASHTSLSSFTRIFPFTIILIAIMTLLHNSPLIGTAGDSAIGVQGGVIKAPRENGQLVSRAMVDRDLVERADSSADTCTRWSHQSAVVNGTLYIYGGQAKQTSKQSTDTWNNNFLYLPLNDSFTIASPTLKGMPQPSGPPPVANGYLWNSYDSLFLYGGEFSDKPATSPVPYAMWEYDIKAGSWKKHDSPKTSDGTNSDPGNQPVMQAAEGAGISVPELGRGWYFGGHLDGFTVAGWSQSVARVYLRSMIEFTFPGYSNKDIKSLSGGQPAGSDGAWRNITQGGLQESKGFTERADGVLVYVPGYGPEGIILGLAGGTDSTFTEMNIIDVFDVATSSWYKQSTAGPAPKIRVNPCAVAASAADGSSTNIYMFGGQNLVPYADQIQYDDMYILTVPSFTWIKVDTSNQSVPYARAGHSCHLWNSQMIVVGGYVGKDIGCDSPGIYVFDASQLKWVNSFTALSGGNVQNQQLAQQANPTGLSGSYGYQVPAAVQSVIGGQATGGATVTAPAILATDGPLATGKPITYTVTGADGATVTETVNSPNSPTSQKATGPNIAAIVAGVVAGLLFIICCYLGFCAWVYRRQLKLYKNHVAMSQRAAAAGGLNEKSTFLGAAGGIRTSAEGSSTGRGKYSTDQSSGPSGSGYRSSNNGAGEVPPLPTGVQAPVGGNSTANSSTEDLMTGQEPSFIGVLLNPRRSLRVVNRD